MRRTRFNEKENCECQRAADKRREHHWMAET